MDINLTPMIYAKIDEVRKDRTDYNGPFSGRVFDNDIVIGSIVRCIGIKMVILKTKYFVKTGEFVTYVKVPNYIKGKEDTDCIIFKTNSYEQAIFDYQHAMINLLF